MEAPWESGGFNSTVFTWKKKSSTFRFILNLKHLNDFAAYEHFKMKSILDFRKIVNSLCGP